MNSTGLDPQRIVAAFDSLVSTADQLSALHGAPLHFSRHRGDGWQVVLARPVYAIRSALAFRASLRALGSDLDCYIGIATGPVQGEIPSDLNSATGRVFTRSGHSLEYAKATARNRFAFSNGALFEAVATLMDYISEDWTPTQAEALVELIAPETETTHADVAARLGKSRQAISKTVNAAGWARLDYALRCIEDAQDD